MGFLKKGDAQKYLRDSNLFDDIVNRVVTDPKMLTDLADEVADHLEDILEDDGAIRDRILAAAVGSEEFRNRVVEKLSTKLQ